MLYRQKLYSYNIKSSQILNEVWMDMAGLVTSLVQATLSIKYFILGHFYLFDQRVSSPQTIFRQLVENRGRKAP